MTGGVSVTFDHAGKTWRRYMHAVPRRDDDVTIDGDRFIVVRVEWLMDAVSDGGFQTAGVFLARRTQP